MILNQTIFNNNIRERSFVLLGTGLSYKTKAEIYGNISQNYRSVTFADISIVNPAYSIDPEISDEKGHTIDMGVRGELNKYISFDISAFNLYYNDLIGFIQKAYDDGSVKSEKGKLLSIVEKGIKGNTAINAGIYLFNEKIFDSLKTIKKSKNLMVKIYLIVNVNIHLKK